MTWQPASAASCTAKEPVAPAAAVTRTVSFSLISPTCLIESAGVWGGCRCAWCYACFASVVCASWFIDLSFVLEPHRRIPNLTHKHERNKLFTRAHLFQGDRRSETRYYQRQCFWYCLVCNINTNNEGGGGDLILNACVRTMKPVRTMVRGRVQAVQKNTNLGDRNRGASIKRHGLGKSTKSWIGNMVSRFELGDTFAACDNTAYSLKASVEGRLKLTRN